MQSTGTDKSVLHFNLDPFLFLRLIGLMTNAGCYYIKEAGRAYLVSSCLKSCFT